MTLKKDMQDVAKALKALTQKVEKVKKQIDKVAKPKAAPVKKATRKAPPKKAAAKKQATAADAALAIIGRSKKGVTNADLMKKTGFDQKKVANLFFKLKKQGKIKSKGKGLYVKA